MIARARIRLPYDIPVAQGFKQTPTRTRWKGQPILVHPLQQGQLDDPTRGYLARPHTPEEVEGLLQRRLIELPVSGITMNGRSLVLCNIVVIDYLDVEFDRHIDSLPKGTQANLSAGVPTVLDVFDLANQYLRWLRSASGLAVIREVDPTRQSWRIEYLSDVGHALPQEDGKFRVRNSHGGDLPSSAIFEPTAEAALQELDNSPPAPWDQLMLEAVDELPATGAAVVLAYAAIEQLINVVVTHNVPSSYSSKKRKTLLSNKRTSPLDRADLVLASLVGQSLRSQPDGWAALEELARLRNKYLHYGIPPTFSTTPSWFAAGHLIRRASEAMIWLEGFLPENMRRRRAITGVDVKYELPHPTSPVFGALGGVTIFLPNDPEPTSISS
jgi:hypothetical protein